MLTIYKASAGSGKTFTLAYEYLKTLLGVKDGGKQTYRLNSPKYAADGARRPNRHRGILAITFTNAATEEMKSRIVKELAALVDDAAGESLYAQWMMRDFGCTAAELSEAAALALAEMLYDYGNFNVSTIDSFFQTVLRTFSREVDHQGDYELSLDTENTVKQSISLMLDELNYSRPRNAERLFRWISKYTIAQLTAGKGYNFFHRDGSILNSLASNMTASLDETYGRHSVALRSYLEDPDRVEAFSRALRERYETALDAPKAIVDSFFAGLKADRYSADMFNSTVVRRMRELARGEKLGDITGQTILKAAAGDTPPEKLVVAKHCKAAGLKPEMLGRYTALMAEFCRVIGRAVAERDFYKTLDDSLGVLDFYGMAIQKLEEYLRENNTVLISDTGELLRRIISDAEMPFIYERLGMKLTNLLIDEFQDTSHLQWHNLRPLVGNSLAEGHDNLIIGDEKQAIYRFRNSDSELLGSIVQTRDFPDSHTLRGFKPEDNTNHRSSGAVVRFNNTVFSRIAARYGIAGYGNVVQTPGSRFGETPGYIRLKFFDKDNMPSDEEIGAALARDIIAQHDRGYRWRDILVLTRKRKQATFVVEYLTTHFPEIAVLSSEALLLSSSGAVRTIMSMLKLVEGSYSGKSDAKDDNAPKYGSRSDTVMMITRYNYYRAEGYDTPDALRLALDSSGETAGSLASEIRAIRAENPANLVALIEAIILHKVTEAQRRDEYAYIAALQDMALKHTEGPDPSLAAFISAYDRNIEKWAIKASGDIDAVEIMTVHKSKGLERACVHIPFGDWELVHDSQSMWLPMDRLEGFDPAVLPPLLYVTASSKSPLRDPAVSPFAPLFADADRYDLVDSINLCYVAFTRAKRELIVYSATKKIGEAVIDAVTMPATSEETSDNARIDTLAGYDAATMTLEYGEPTVPLKQEKTAATVDAGVYPVLFRQDTRQLTSIDDALATHLDIGGEEDKYIVDRPEPGYVSRMMDAARRGNDMHAILADVRAIGDLRRAVDRYAARTAVPDDVREEYYAELDAAIKAGGETVAAWFDPVCKVYAERTLYVAGSGNSFRPDRIVVRPDGQTTVIDYKFTTEPRPEHFGQMENYLALLASIGRENAGGYLWYPLLGRIIKVR
ncbi:MAG: UvrD-helicase domain-containing protein [Muribaculaceae bacterium]|nr:UvrD-helicase domain-containing protein [Muribaculaceae bacterium]